MQSKKILLCALNSQYIHSNPAVWSLKVAAAQYAGEYQIELPEIEIGEYTINDSYDQVLGSIVRKKPDILGFSVYIWNVRRVQTLLEDIRAVLPKCQIILGGPEVSFGTPQIPAHLYDHVLAGEGERAFFTLLLRLFGVKSPKGFDAHRPLAGEEIPFIYNDENIRCFENRIVYYESSRGCPFSCAYCLSGAEDRVRFKPLEQVYQEIDFFIRHKVPQVKFVDRTFNCNPVRSQKILAYILEHAGDTSMNFHFECAGDLFDEEQLATIRQAPKGLFQFEIGIQSTYEPALHAACRKTDTRKVFTNVARLMEEGNANVHVDLIAGLPDEDYTRFTQSFNEVYALKAHQLQLGFLKILKGATLNQVVDRYGYVFSKNPPYEILQNHSLSNEEILRMKAVEDVLNRYYNSGRYGRTLSFLMEKSSTPWALYEDLSRWFLEKGLLGRGISARNASEELLAYAVSRYPEERETLCWCLLEDFYRADPSDVVPISLKPYHKPAAIGRKMVPDCPSGKTVRFIREQIYFVDYGKKDPVTGLFSMDLFCPV